MQTLVRFIVLYYTVFKEEVRHAAKRTNVYKDTITKTPKPICESGLGSFHYNSTQITKGGSRMNPNADYLGIVTMLRSLREQGLVSGSEAKKIAARLRVQLGADIIISL